MAQTATAAIGHNSGEAKSLNPFDLRLSSAFKPIEERIFELEAAMQRVPKEINDDNAGLVVDFAKQVKDALRDNETIRKDLKAPFIEKGRRIDDAAKGLAGPLDKMAKAMNQRLDAYNREREARERKAREEAEAEARRKAAEAEAKAKAEREAAEKAAAEAKSEEERKAAEQRIAAVHQSEAGARLAAQEAEKAAKAKPALLRGTGATAISQKYWHIETDYAAIDLNRLRAHLSQDAIDAAIRKLVQENAEGDTCLLRMPGVTVERRTRSAIR